MFVRPDQLLEEFEKVIDIILDIFRTLKFDNYTAQISLRDKTNREKYIGTDENWEKAEQAIIRATEEKGCLLYTSAPQGPPRAPCPAP